MNDRVTKKKLGHYLSLTERALKGVSCASQMGEQFLDMAKRYYSDAMHFMGRGDYVTAFAAVSYAHGWIDSGVRAGFLRAPDASSSYVMPL